MKLKRITALTLSLLMLFSMLFATSVSAFVISDKGFDYQRITGTNTVEVVSITENGVEDNKPVVTIPDSLGGYPVVSIGAAAFINNENQQQIVLPNTLLTISNSAFYDASSLTDITIPAKVSKIEYSAFGYCTSLKFVNFKGTAIDTINKYTFYNCTKLDEVILPENLSIIDEGAFAKCTSLTKIYIPASTFSISETAFKNSDNVTIYGEYGSSAHIYALKNNIPFISLSDKDYTDITNWINAVNYLDSSKYTAESYSAVEVAYNTALKVKNNFFSTKSEIDAASNTLKAAYNGLVLNARVTLEQLVADIEYFIDNNNPGNYVLQTYYDMFDAYTSAKNILEDENATEVMLTGAYNQLQSKYNSLMFKPKYDLIVSIDRANAIILSEEQIYTKDTVQALSSELINAKAVLSDENSGYSDYHSANFNLCKKLDALHLISYDVLSENINRIQQDINTNYYKYTDNSIKLVQEEIDTSNTLLSNFDATNDELIEQNNKLTQAYASLVPLTLGDVNSDGSITVADVLLILRNVVDLTELDARQQYAADLNSSGTVTVLDAIMLQQLILEII